MWVLALEVEDVFFYSCKRVFVDVVLIFEQFFLRCTSYKQTYVQHIIEIRILFTFEKNIPHANCNEYKVIYIPSLLRLFSL